MDYPFDVEFDSGGVEGLAGGFSAVQSQHHRVNCIFHMDEVSGLRVDVSEKLNSEVFNCHFFSFCQFAVRC